MKNKPFEIFKLEDFKEKIMTQDIVNIANSIINERGKRGFTFLDEGPDACENVTVSRYTKLDTHEALVFLRPIEDEKEECNHLLFCHLLETSSGVTSYRDFTNTFCPRCGVKFE